MTAGNCGVPSEHVLRRHSELRKRCQKVKTHRLPNYCTFPMLNISFSVQLNYATDVESQLEMAIPNHCSSAVWHTSEIQWKENVETCFYPSGIDRIMKSVWFLTEWSKTHLLKHHCHSLLEAFWSGHRGRRSWYVTAFSNLFLFIIIIIIAIIGIFFNVNVLSIVKTSEKLH